MKIRLAKKIMSYEYVAKLHLRGCTTKYDIRHKVPYWASKHYMYLSGYIDANVSPCIFKRYTDHRITKAISLIRKRGRK